MEVFVEFITNSAGAFDFGSLIKLFGLMIGMDGVILTLYAIIRGFNGK